jgi:starch phosphorylase
MGYSPEWVAMSKRSIATIAPRYNVIRMVGEYVKFYAPPPARVSTSADGFAPARALADWKTRIRNAWAGVRLRCLETPRAGCPSAGQYVQVAVQLGGLLPEDVTVEALFGRPDTDRARRYSLTHSGALEHGEHLSNWT